MNILDKITQNPEALASDAEIKGAFSEPEILSREVLSRVLVEQGGDEGVARSDEFVPSAGCARFYDEVEARNQLLIGGIRSGKTTIAIRKIIKLMLQFPGLKVLVTRTTGPALNATTVADFESICPIGLISQKGTFKDPYRNIKFNNGSEVAFIAFEKAHIEKVKSMTCGVVWIEEASMFSVDQWYWLLGRASQTVGMGVNEYNEPVKTKIPKQYMILTTNAAGRNWIWKRFIKNYDNDPEYFYVRVSTLDNAEHLSPAYLKSLKALPLNYYRRMVLAEDEDFEGLVFPMFRSEVHILDKVDWVPPGNCHVIVGMDYGYQTPTCAVWVAKLEGGACVVFKEYVRRMATPRTNATNILTVNAQMVARGMKPPVMWVIDSATKQHKGENEEGKTTFDLLVESGLYGLLPGSRDRAGRILRVSMMLERDKYRTVNPITNQISPDGWPSLYFCRDCTNTIREHEEWEWKDQAEESADTKKEAPQDRNDHCIDALGYILAEGVPESERDPIELRLYQNSDAARVQRHKEALWKKNHKGFRRRFGSV